MKIKSFIEKNKTSLSLVLLLFGISLLLSLMMNVEPDYFWHIKAGEAMFKNGILTVDIFSWIVKGKYWMSHEWLFEVTIYVFKILFGNFHMLIFSIFCLFFLLIILFLGNKENYLKNIPFTLFWIALSLILIDYVQCRPHLFSFCFIAFTLWALYDLYKCETSKKVYFLPFLAIIWANVHGGSSNLSYIFCFVFLIGGLFKFSFSKIEAIPINARQIKKYLFIAILCMFGVCVNVHGFKMFIYPYENLTNSIMLNNITEWQPTTLANFRHYIYFILVVIIFFVMLFSKKKILFMDLILFGIGVFLGLKSIRFWPYTYIISSFIIFNYIGKRKNDRGTNLMICFISVILICFFVANVSTTVKSFDSRVLSDKVINVIKSEKPKKLFNMYDFGGELVYNDIPVFIDGRADLYSKYNYIDYLNISNLNGDYVELIDKYEFDYFLVDDKFPINTYLKYNNDFELVYRDEGILLYKKID